jgi:hypothetical protein
MRLHRAGYAISVSLVSLALLLTAPDIGTSQEPDRPGLSADKPLSYALSSISWFSWNGIWVRSNGLWAWRPTVRYDWNAYFRCEAGYGCGGIGLNSHLLWIWGGGDYGRWNLVPAGWMWFPGQRFYGAWNLWFLGPRHGFGAYGGAYGFGPRFSSLFLTGWPGDLNMAPTVPRYIPAHQDEQRRQATSTSGTHTRDRTEAQVDPASSGTIVRLSLDDEDGGASGRIRLGPPLEPGAESAGGRSELQEMEGQSGDPTSRKRYLSPTVDDRPSPTAARSWKESELRSGSSSSADRRGESVKPSPVPSAAGRSKSPRSPAAGGQTTGRSKPGKTAAPAKE